MTKRGLLYLGLVSLMACDASKFARGASYQLVGADGKPLPIVLEQREGCLHRLISGEVRFDGRGGYQSTYQIRRSCPDSSRTLPNVGTTGKFHVRNDTAFFTDAAGKPAGHGFMTADSLIVQGPDHRLQYSRHMP